MDRINFRKRGLAFGALFALAVAACATPVGAAPVNEEAKVLEFPTEIDGAVDTGWEVYLTQYNACVDAGHDYCEVYERTTKDTYVSQLLMNVLVQNSTIEAVSGMTQDEFDEFTNTLSKENDAWLDARIDEHGWFNISEYGKNADKAAFFLVQHSSDVEFQKKTLSLLEGLAAEDETSKSSVASLSDRVAIIEEREQLFGTQGGCEAVGDWKPFPLVEGDVDTRRREMGLEPLEEYTSRMSGFCT